MGDHAETIQIDFDPHQVSFDELLEVFWQSHNPTSGAWSRQYMSSIFVHDEEQRKQAEASKMHREAELGRKIFTEIADYKGFTLAEDYH
ncbi:MAG: peptide-methionine (S)-S-oxide reductase [Anaerolineaceae bacterium]|nr:peptide-methionine (S)-S-oxide reductase [Anaerolineaceae bacterium]